MLTISVCIGSACHLKGSYKVIKELQNEIEKLNIKDKVELKASFCLGHCTNAVSVKVDNGDVVSVKPESVNQFLKSYVISKL